MNVDTVAQLLQGISCLRGLPLGPHLVWNI